MMYNLIFIDMKRVLLIFLTLLVIGSKAQQTFVHTTTEGTLRQNYHSVLTSDGNLIIDEDIYDGEQGNVDVGIKFLKINPEQGIIDSLFIENVKMSLDDCLLARNHNESDESVYVYISSDNAGNYFNVIRFSDNMEVVSNESNLLPIEGDMMRQRFFMDKNGDIIVSWRDTESDTCLCWFGKFGIDGTLKIISDPISITGTMPVYRPFFYFDDEPIKIGCFMCDYHNLPNGGVSYNNNLFIYIIDENLNLDEIKTINETSVYGVSSSLHMSVVAMDNGNFAIMRPRYDSDFNKHYGVCKYNQDCHLLKYHDIQGVANWTASQPMVYDVENKNVYVTWYDSNDYSTQGMATHLRCLDNDLKRKWDQTFISHTKGNVTSSIKIINNNKVAVSGFVSDKNYFTFASFIDCYDNVTENVSENNVIVYPNPTRDFISIVFAENAICHSVEIYSLDGRLIMTFHGVYQQDSTIDISSLTTGIYLLKLTMSDGSEFTERLIKE